MRSKGRRRWRWEKREKRVVRGDRRWYHRGEGMSRMACSRMACGGEGRVGMSEMTGSGVVEVGWRAAVASWAEVVVVVVVVALRWG